MRHRLAILTLLVLSTLLGFGVTTSPAAKNAGGGLSIENSCAATLSVQSASACGNGGDPHLQDSGCFHPPVIPFGYEGYPYWAIFQCWNPVNGWHIHIWY